MLVFGGGTTAPAGTTQIETARRRSGPRARGRTRRRRRGDDRPIRLRGRRLRRIGDEPRGASPPPTGVPIATSPRCPSRFAIRRSPRSARASTSSAGLLANGHPTGAVQLVDTRAAHGAASSATSQAARRRRRRRHWTARSTSRAVSTAPGPTARDLRLRTATEPSFLRAGSLRVPVANAGAAVTGGRLWIVGGESSGGAPTTDVQMVVPNRAFGSAGSPAPARPSSATSCSIADRGNDRLLAPQRPQPGRLALPAREAARRRPAASTSPTTPSSSTTARAIISNQEHNEHDRRDRLSRRGSSSGPYGHPRVTGLRPGLPARRPTTPTCSTNGHDHASPTPRTAASCSSTRRTSASSTRSAPPDACTHDPPSALGSPNGDTPLAERQPPGLRDQRLLDRRVHPARASSSGASSCRSATRPTPSSSAPTATSSPTTRARAGSSSSTGAGKILYRYQPAGGPGMLNHPSPRRASAQRRFMVNDDYRDRMVAIDPSTKALVWQYGVTGHPGTAPGPPQHPRRLRPARSRRRRRRRTRRPADSSGSHRERQ